MQCGSRKKNVFVRIAKSPAGTSVDIALSWAKIAVFSHKESFLNNKKTVRLLPQFLNNPI